MTEMPAESECLRYLLAQRLTEASNWAGNNDQLADLPLGYFGASTGAGAALVAAANEPRRIEAIVSYGGRPDLAGSALQRVSAPTRLIVGGAVPTNLPHWDKQLGDVTAAEHSRSWGN